ncbi:MAG TPA: phosphatase PAP2 family protein [Williamwhitmania sp.]|nr:phosphatase PAP2 family protein [Williamwhitmania sp.]
MARFFSFTFVLLILAGVISGQNLDIRILRTINLDRNKHWDKTMQFMSNSEAAVSIATPAVILGVGLIKGDPQIKSDGITIASAFLLSSAMTTILKYSVKRPRPFTTYPDIEKLSAGGSYSFPSGHTSSAFATATSLSLAYPKWYVIVPSFAWASTVGYSRMYLGVHYPSDVLAGAIIGAASSYLCYKGQQWLNHRKKRKAEPVVAFY